MPITPIRVIALIGVALSVLHAADDRLPGEKQSFGVEVEVLGGSYRMFTAGVDHPQLRLAASNPKHLDLKLLVTLTARDLDDRPVSWNQQFVWPLSKDEAKTEKTIPLEFDPGYYRIGMRIVTELYTVNREIDLGIVPPAVPGLRPESFFASNTSGLRRGEELKFLQLLGLKVQRVHFQARLAAKPPAVSEGKALTLDFSEQDKAFAEAKAHDLWALPIAGYAFEGTKTELAEKVHMHGPPRDFAEFTATWRQILDHYPEVTTYEFWNEPWIFGWTWAAEAAEYRRFQKQWCEMALTANPKLRIIAGNSCMFTEDHIEPDPGCWRGLLAGTSHHPYSGCGWPTMRGGAQGRSIDAGAVVTRRMGLPYYYITEGGTEYQTPGVAGERQAKCNNRENALKIVHYFVRSALAGAFQGNAQWDIGYGPGWTKANTTFAVMTHFLEDRPVVADIWPAHELLWGAICAAPDQITEAVKALPRAAELAARWSVAIPAARAGDRTKVAVVWSETGADNQHPDAGGTLTIADASGIAAFDATGRGIPAAGGVLTVPFGEAPVYLVSETLDVIGLRARIASARIGQVTALNLSASSLMQPADQAQTVQVRIENQLNRVLQGTLAMKSLADGATTTTAFTVSPAALIEVAVPWRPTSLSAANQYGVEIIATTEAGTVTRRQVLAAARFAKRVIAVDGALDDWKGVTPVLLDSDQLKGGFDPTQYLLNPNRDRPTGSDAGKRVVARVYTAYDERNVYLAAAVNEERLTCTAGEPATHQGVPLPYRTGVPDGLTHIRNCGDVLMFAFGFRDRVPGWGRQIGDPWAWKGQFYDTDYHYAAHLSSDGPQLVRQWGPDTTRRTAYQTETVPGYGPVPDARIAITRDEAAKLSIYEIAIPRAELALFDPSAGRCRFGFILVNDEPINGAKALPWSEAAGVFDHWAGAGSFGPSWEESLPCQTFFGIEK